MEVILLEHVEKLGKMGEKVTVKNGYARNYLLPNKKALRATEANLAVYEQQKAELEAHNKKLREEADKLKILTAQNWQSVNFHPYVADQPLLGESSYRSTGGPDIKWTIDRNGTYRITVNTALETIRGELIGDTNGRAFSQSVTSIDGQQTAGGITVTSDGTAVTVSSSHEVAHVRIISASGAVTATGIATDNPYVSHPLPHGIYIVCASTQTGIIRHKVAIE